MTGLVTFRGNTPQIHENVFIAPTCAVIGDVTIGPESSVWYSTVIRGDVMPIVIGNRTSIQDGAIVHVTAGFYKTTIGDSVTVGHRAIVHGCEVQSNTLVGMGSTLLDGCVIEEGAIVGAGAVVTPGTVIPKGMLAIGTPARPVRPVNDKEKLLLKYSADHYVELTHTYIAESLSHPVSFE